MSRGDGGAAFPCQPRDRQGGFVDEMQPGMTKREAFAMAAMQGLLSTRFRDGNSDWYAEEIAEMAYTQADAMLAARGAK